MIGLSLEMRLLQKSGLSQKPIYECVCGCTIDLSATFSDWGSNGNKLQSCFACPECGRNYLDMVAQRQSVRVGNEWQRILSYLREVDESMWPE